MVRVAGIGQPSIAESVCYAPRVMSKRRTMSAPALPVVAEVVNLHDARLSRRMQRQLFQLTRSQIPLHLYLCTGLALSCPVSTSSPDMLHLIGQHHHGAVADIDRTESVQYCLCMLVWLHDDPCDAFQHGKHELSCCFRKSCIHRLRRYGAPCLSDALCDLRLAGLRIL
jgi:hypothetical protein